MSRPTLHVKSGEKLAIEIREIILYASGKQRSAQLVVRIINAVLWAGALEGQT